jgi:hypothetical protein
MTKVDDIKFEDKEEKEEDIPKIQNTKVIFV